MPITMMITITTLNDDDGDVRKIGAEGGKMRQALTAGSNLESEIWWFFFNNKYLTKKLTNNWRITYQIFVDKNVVYTVCTI